MWHEEFFGEDYFNIYLPLLTPERTAAEVDALVTLLAIRPPLRILDVPCGFGRHAVELAKQGFGVVGLDASPTQLAKARTDAEAAAAPLTLVEGDMRAMPFDAEFDLVLNLFTSFGYFSDEENEAAIAQFARALRPGGRLFMELSDRDGILASKDTSRWTALPKGRFLLEEFHHDLLTGRDRTTYTLVGDGAPRSYTIDLRLYSPHELCRLLERHGLRVTASYAGFSGAPLAKDSRRMAFTAQRP